jgi:hypothetical protein
VGAQIVGERRRGEAAIPVGLTIGAFVHNLIDLAEIEPRIECRPVRIGDAVHRPRAAVLRVRGMIGRMPIPRCVHAREARRELIDRREDPIAGRDRERPAGQEVVLHVDDDQRIVRRNRDAHATTMLSSLSGTKMRLRTVLPSVCAITPLAAVASA